MNAEDFDPPKQFQAGAAAPWAAPLPPEIEPGMLRERLITPYSPGKRLARNAAAAGDSVWTRFSPLDELGGRLVHGVAMVDRSGRVHEAAVFSALGWLPGTEVVCQRVGHALVYAPAPAEASLRLALDLRRRIKLPLAERRLLGIRTGGRVWLVAEAETAQLLIAALTPLDRLAHDLLPRTADAEWTGESK
jgi:hypothetical protein